MTDTVKSLADYWPDPKGNMWRAENIAPRDRDMDGVVRKIHAFGADLSAQMWRFREYTMRDISLYCDRLIKQYGVQPRGKKGNVTLTSFDGCLRVTLSIADVIEAGPEIQAAQALIEDCIEQWSANAQINLRALVSQAFRRDDCGRLSVAQLLNLKRIEIDDPRWRQAQRAIGDALRPSGRAEYVRLYSRAKSTDKWKQLPMHLANVCEPAEAGQNTPAGSLEMRVRSAVAEARHRGLKQGEIREVVKNACSLKPKTLELGLDG